MSPLLILALSVAVVGITQLLKQWKLVQASVWYIPTALVVGVGALLGYQLLSGNLTAGGIIDGTLYGVITGAVGSVLYSIVRQIRGTDQ